VDSKFPALLDAIENTEKSITNATIENTPEMDQFKEERDKIKNEFQRVISSIDSNMRNPSKVQTTVNINAIIDHYGFTDITGDRLTQKVDKIMDRLRNVSNLTILQNFEKIIKFCEKRVPREKIETYIKSESDVFSGSNPLLVTSLPTTQLPSDEINKFKTEITSSNPNPKANPAYERSEEYLAIKTKLNDFKNGPFQLEIFEKLFNYYDDELNNIKTVKIPQLERFLKVELNQIGDLSTKDNKELSDIYTTNVKNIVDLATALAKDTIVYDYIDKSMTDTEKNHNDLLDSLGKPSSTTTASGTTPAIMPSSSTTASSATPSTSTLPTTGGTGLKLRKRAKDVVKSGSSVFKVDDTYYVDMKQLNKNVLNIKYLKNQNQVPKFAPVLVSDELKDLAIASLKTKTADPTLASKVSKAEFRLFKRFAKILNIAINDTAGHNEDEEENKKFKILLGEWSSGNDSEIIRKELKKYVLRALQEGQLSRTMAYQYLIELS
jgi:hypothetical protein